LLEDDRIGRPERIEQQPGRVTALLPAGLEEADVIYYVVKYSRRAQIWLGGV
jgi:hypothetical protein